jgi:hypothetical protein
MSRHYAHVRPDGSLIGVQEFGSPPPLPPEGAIPITEQQHAHWHAHPHYVWDDATGEIVDAGRPPPPFPVPKALIVERLIAEGALRAVRAELGFGKADDELDDAQLALRERWEAVASFMSNDEALRAALRRANVDPDAVLTG